MKNIRNSKFSKILASYLAIQLLIMTVQPANLFALTGGPSQPEFNAFTPIGTSDMVNLSSGDFNYNIPIMDVGGYPLNLAYDSGISMDQEASWVGLGWNLNVGQIARNVRGIPDDFNGDEMTYENNMKPNKTVGMTFSINGQLSGTEEVPGPLSGNASATLLHNNYNGFSFTPSFGLSYQFSSGTSVGMNMTPSVDDGVSITPTISQGFSSEFTNKEKTTTTAISNSVGIGTTYNSRQGITSFNINTSTTSKTTKKVEGKKDEVTKSSRGNSASVSFIDNTFTPTKRTAYYNGNYTFAASLGVDFWPVSAELGASAFATTQSLKSKENNSKAYGYENTEYASPTDVLDFNRENERTVSKNTLVLPTVNYTYDLYNIQGQGTGGQFRPFKGQVGYVNNQLVVDSGASFSLGAEIEAATGFHGGVDIKYSPTVSWTGVWNTPALNKFKKSNTNALDYEPTYFKSIGDMSIDDDSELYDNLSEEHPMALDLTEATYGKQAVSKFNVKKFNPVTNAISVETKTISSHLKRSKRERRNQAILKVSKSEALNDPFIIESAELDGHHTNGVKVLQADGSTYVYGEAAVNKIKEEVTFATEGTRDLAEGTIGFSTLENSPGNSSGTDNYFNKIGTPDYAHTYLLTAVLSSDYEDLTGDGPTDDDLGAYTKFSYDNEAVNSSNYKWRVPFEKATYNPGLYTQTNDQKGNYLYGVKEVKYASKIETKTHVAVFDLTERKDGYGVEDNMGGLSEVSKMYKINKIELYSKPEYKKMLLELEETGTTTITPIKVAHFEYDYSLVGTNGGTQDKLPNNSGDSEVVDGVNINSEEGKLTLKKVYFTYRGSNMGKYTPYKFNYDNDNPAYQIKSYDVWGNYKPLFEGIVEEQDANQDGVTDGFEIADVNSQSYGCEIDYPITAQEFPFIKQNNKVLQDLYVAAWTLSSIDLPSGGRMELQYESDDYKYVQDREAMQMFKVVGVRDAAGAPMGDNLYIYDVASKYLTIELLEPLEGTTEADRIAEFTQKYIGEHIDKPIFYRFLVNMEKETNCSYDYVEGYCNLDITEARPVILEGDLMAHIPIDHVPLEGETGNDVINPISKAGWYFARQHLSRFAYGHGDNSPNTVDLQEIINALGGWLPIMSEILRGPNGFLKERGIANKFKPEKSWIRLKHPTNAKLGGDLRVKKIQMYDNWDTMVNNEQNDLVNPYANFYGQEYNYVLENGQGSSGVATWEPNMSKENPFIEPFFDKTERLSAHSYVEKPLGKSFYPSPMITYGRVEVKNLSRERENENVVEVVKKHATGKVVNEFYTSKDFPTIADYTNIEGGYVTNQDNILDNILKLNINTELTLSQGFSVVTNDMNGKSKRQEVFNESNMPISSVDYIYNVSETSGQLDNELSVVMPDGAIEKKEIGTNYDVITDFNESYNLSETYGVNTNVTFFIIPLVIPIPILLGQLPFQYHKNESKLHTTTTTKVVHKIGILKEKIAKDLGAKVSTRNLAWDAVSGQVLLTETINEYDDNYYNFTYPAHWRYEGMGQAVENLGIETWLESANIVSSSSSSDSDTEGTTSWYKLKNTPIGNGTISTFFAPGDEVLVYQENGDPIYQDNRYWVNQIGINNNGVDEVTNENMILINRNGHILNACGEDPNAGIIKIKVVRSHKRNLQSASMASITSMVNPMLDNAINEDDYVFNSNIGDNPKIINASAVEYKDFWRPQNELSRGYLGQYGGGPDLGSLEGIGNAASTTGMLGDNLASYPNDEALIDDLVPYPKNYFNPFVNNIKGDWRAVRSYAYLTGRSTTSEGSPRNDGFFASFNPFYVYDANTGKWVVDDDNWTYASEVTRYSPYGAELENKDALNRYSSAQYGYGYTLPTAVASNSEYHEMGYDGFEDYGSYGTEASSIKLHFSYFNEENINAGASLSETESHTGRYSLKVAGGETATTTLSNTSRFMPEQDQLPELDCSSDDTTGGGNLCYKKPRFFQNGTTWSFEDAFGSSNITVSVTPLSNSSDQCGLVINNGNSTIQFFKQGGVVVCSFNATFTVTNNQTGEVYNCPEINFTAN